jgi:hypothetical protein
MEIKYTPVSHEAFLRSLKPVEQTPQTSGAFSGPSMLSAPQLGPTPSTSSNPINWGKVVVGAIAVAALFYLIDYYIQEHNRKD